MKVAVTGVGGGVGQSVMKALSIARLPVEVYALDVQPYSAGLFRATEGIVVRRPEDGGLDAWAKLLSERSVEALIPGSDHDLVPLSAARDAWAKMGLPNILVSDPELVALCRDKARTVEAFRAHSIPAPQSIWDATADEATAFAERVGWPVVIKPRAGSASRNVTLARDEEELRFYLARTPDPIVQEWLNLRGAAEEFTCAVFVDRRGRVVGTFEAKRDLSGGATYRAEIGEWPGIAELLRKIGEAFRPRGPLNVQLRLTERGPVPFEINVRCSGTAAIRAHFGYNEPEMMLRHYVLGEDLETPKPRRGYALRYWNEVFVEGATRASLERGPQGLRGEVRPWP